MKRPRLSLRTKLCLVVLALYALTAAWAEVSHWRANRDETPAYNRVDLAARNLPPLSRSPKSEVRSPESEVPSPKSEVRSQRSEVRGPKTEVQSPESEVKNSSGADASKGAFHLLGTDNLGRDVALRLAQGTRIAFHVGIVTTCIAIPLGAFLGLVSGYFRRGVDAILCALATVTASIPSMLLILAIALVAGRGMLGIYLGIGLTTWVGVFRTVRGETLKHRDAGYVQAARALGYGPWRILLRHILPNVSHVIIIAFSTRFPAAVGTEVFMSFLGIGAQDEPSWGVMINNARVRLWTGQWWEGLSVTLAVFGLVLCFNLLGDALRDALDPTLGRSHA